MRKRKKSILKISHVLARMWRKGNCLLTQDPTSGNISQESWNITLKEYMHPYLHSSIIYNSQDLETAQVPISRWVDKKGVVHLHNRILCSHKKGTLTFWNNMDGPGEYYAKWNNPVRERQIPHDFIYMWNLMNKQNKPNRDRLVDRE